MESNTRTQYAIHIRPHGPFTVITADDAEYAQAEGRVVFVRTIEAPEWRVAE